MNRRQGLNVSLVRQDFPMLNQTMHGKPLVYFDSAATSQKPAVVIDAIADFYRQHYGTVHRAVYELALQSSENYERTRCQVRDFLHAAKEEEIIFTRGTTESINLVAYCFGKAFVQPGDEVLISAMEHHSNTVPWQMLCEDRGAILKVIPMNHRGELLLEDYASLLTSRTRLVAVTHVSNALGTINPIKQMSQMAHHVGAKILVDGAQSAPHFKIDVQDLDVDFFVFSGHKIMGPTGIGILYGKSEWLHQMPPYQGGGDMVDKVTFAKTIYRHPPLKFEAGTPMIAEVVGLGVALNYMQSLGLDNIQKWERELVQYATAQLMRIPGLKIIGTAAEKGSLISFVVDSVHALDLGTLLDLKGFAIRTGHHCAQPVMDFFRVPATARVSFACFNTKEEIDNFIVALESVIGHLKKTV